MLATTGLMAASLYSDYHQSVQRYRAVNTTLAQATANLVQESFRRLDATLRGVEIAFQLKLLDQTYSLPSAQHEPDIRFRRALAGALETQPDLFGLVIFDGRGGRVGGLYRVTPEQIGLKGRVRDGSEGPG
jgi:hypothetical protein